MARRLRRHHVHGHQDVAQVDDLPVECRHGDEPPSPQHPHPLHRSGWRQCVGDDHRVDAWAGDPVRLRRTSCRTTSPSNRSCCAPSTTWTTASRSTTRSTALVGALHRLGRPAPARSCTRSPPPTPSLATTSRSSGWGSRRATTPTAGRAGRSGCRGHQDPQPGVHQAGRLQHVVVPADPRQVAHQPAGRELVLPRQVDQREQLRLSVLQRRRADSTSTSTASATG